jgi:hypothetical protein
MLTLTCIHVALIVFVSIHVPRNQRSGESIIADTNIVPPAVTDNCGAGQDMP